MLQSESGERNLVNRQLGLPKIEEVQQIAQSAQTNEQVAGDSTIGVANKNQVDKAQKSGPEPIVVPPMVEASEK